MGGLSAACPKTSSRPYCLSPRTVYFCGFMMNPFRRFYLVILLGGLSQAVAQPSDDPGSSTLFTVAGKPVTIGEFTYLFKKNHPRKEDYTEEKVSNYLDLLVTFKMKVAEAGARGYDTTRAFRKEFTGYRSELKKPYLADKDQLNYLTRQAYERMTLEVRASHILVSFPPNPAPADTLAAYAKITSLQQRLQQGEDFATLARNNSDEPMAKTTSGDLGYFTALQMVYPFEEAAYNLKTGEVSRPVRTRFGYHLIRVTDRRLARGEVEVSHIILRTGTKDDNRVKTKIFELQAELQGGRSWDEICKEYSDDPSTKNSGGRLRPFGVGALANIPQFEKVAFSLHQPGEISDPFQSVYGWHIIRLERRIPVPPFEQAEESLRRRISRDERLKFAEDRVRTQQLKQLGYTENIQSKNEILALADSSLLKSRWRFKGTPDLRSRDLFVLNGKRYSIDAFVRYAEREQQPQVAAPAEAMRQLYNAFLYSQLDEWEEGDLVNKFPEYRNLVNEYREGILLFTIMEKEVWNKATEDTVGLRVFYEKNKQKYAGGERVRARVFGSDDSVFVAGIGKKVQAGDSLTRAELKRFKSVQGPRNFAAGESKAVDRAPKVTGLHQVKVDATHYLVQVESLVPPGIRSLDEIRSRVISDYQDHLEKEWVKVLHSKYAVKVNSKARKSVIRELTQP